jgi:hypothetical protein
VSIWQRIELVCIGHDLQAKQIYVNLYSDRVDWGREARSIKWGFIRFRNLEVEHGKETSTRCH